MLGFNGACDGNVKSIMYFTMGQFELLIIGFKYISQRIKYSFVLLKEWHTCPKNYKICVKNLVSNLNISLKLSEQ